MTATSGISKCCRHSHHKPTFSQSKEGCAEDALRHLARKKALTMTLAVMFLATAGTTLSVPSQTYEGTDKVPEGTKGDSNKKNAVAPISKDDITGHKPVGDHFS